MTKKNLGEKKEVLLRVELPDPHAHKTIKALVTLQGWSAHIVEELEEVQQRPRATILRELVEDGLRTRMVDLDTEAEPGT